MKGKTLRRAMAVVLSAAMAVSGTIISDSTSDAAAKKPALASKKGTIKVGQTKTVKIKNVTKKKVKKLTVSSSKKGVATVKKSGKTAIKVTGKKAGKAKITAKVTLKKAIKKKKVFKLTYTATVKAATPVATETPTEEPAAALTVTSFADLLSTLAEAQAMPNGAQVTLTTSEAVSFEIPEAVYNKVDLVVDAANADIVNAATFKSVTIKAIKASTWTEKGKANRFIVTAATPVRIIADAIAEIVSIVFKGTAAAASKIEVAGKVDQIRVESNAPVDVTATGTANIGEVDVASTASGAKVDITANGTATVGTVKVEDTKAAVVVEGDSKNAIKVEAVTGATIDTTKAPAGTTVTEIKPSASATPTATTTPTASATPTVTPGSSGSGSGGGGGTSTVAVSSVTLSTNAPKVGDTVSATVTGTNTSSATYKWYTCDTNSSTASDWTQVATTTTLTVTDAMFGKYIKLIVSGTSTSKEAVTTSAVAAKEGNYVITYSDTTGGTISGLNQAAPASTITLTVTPNAGYKLTALTATGEGTLDLDPAAVAPAGGTYTFAMPAHAVTVSATFVNTVATLALKDSAADGYSIEGTTITVPYGATVANLKDNIELGEATSVSFKVLAEEPADATAYGSASDASGALTSAMKAVALAQDGETLAVYSITITPEG